MSEDMELVCFQLIANSGAAKSSYMEAVELAKKGDFKGADEKVTEAEECFVQAHKIHADLIQKEAAGERNEVTVLFVHAQDHLMTSIEVRTLAENIIRMNERLWKLENRE